MINLNNLKEKMAEAKTAEVFGIPILIGYPGVRTINCEYFKHHPRYKTEYCKHPDYVKLYVKDGRGIVKGCETCPLFSEIETVRMIGG